MTDEKEAFDWRALCRRFGVKEEFIRRAEGKILNVSDPAARYRAIDHFMGSPEQEQDDHLAVACAASACAPELKSYVANALTRIPSRAPRLKEWLAAWLPVERDPTVLTALIEGCVDADDPALWELPTAAAESERATAVQAFVAAIGRENRPFAPEKEAVLKGTWKRFQTLAPEEFVDHGRPGRRRGGEDDTPHALRYLRMAISRHPGLVENLARYRRPGDVWGEDLDHGFLPTAAALKVCGDLDWAPDEFERDEGTLTAGERTFRVDPPFAWSQDGRCVAAAADHAHVVVVVDLREKKEGRCSREEAQFLVPWKFEGGFLFVLPDPPASGSVDVKSAIRVSLAELFGSGRA